MKKTTPDISQQSGGKSAQPFKKLTSAFRKEEGEATAGNEVQAGETDQPAPVSNAVSGTANTGNSSAPVIPVQVTEEKNNDETEEKDEASSETSLSAQGMFDQPEDEDSDEAKAKKIIAESINNPRAAENPPVILIMDSESWDNEKLWPYFAMYLSASGVFQYDEETEESWDFTFSDRSSAGIQENGQWVVYGPLVEDFETEESEIEDELNTSEDALTEENITTTAEDEEAFIEEGKAINFTEETTKGEEIERNWDPVYSGANDPAYGNDISVDRELTPAQKEKYGWVAIRPEWRLANPDKSITDTILNKWIRRNLSKGWKPGDAIPNLKEIKVKFDNDIPVIKAMNSNDAWAEAGRIGVSRNQNAPFYWENPMTGERKRILYNFAPEDEYYNRTHLKPEKKATYVGVMVQILGNESLRAAVIAEKGYGPKFASLVRRTQSFMNMPLTGKMTPDVDKRFGEKSAQLYNIKQEALKKEREAREAYNKVTVTLREKTKQGKTRVEYKYHNELESYYVDYSKLYKVKMAVEAWGSDVDSLVYDLDVDDIRFMSFDTRIGAIKNIYSGTIVTDGDERSLARLFKYILPHEKPKLREWIKNNPSLVAKVKAEITYDQYRQSFNQTIANLGYVDHNDFYKVAYAVNNDTYSADSDVFHMPDQQLRTLEYDNGEYDLEKGTKINYTAGQKNLKTGKILKYGGSEPSLRIKAIRVIANGFSVGSEDESTLIRLLTILPSNEAVAKMVRRAIAYALLEKKKVGELELNMALLRQMHDVTHDEYSRLRAALDEIFDENGDVFANKIREKLNGNSEVKSQNSISKDFDHIEYYGEYGSKNAYKYLSSYDKIRFIKKIQAGAWEGDTDEQTIIEILESVGKPTSSALAANADKAAEYEKKEKQNFYNMLSQNAHGLTPMGILASFHGEEHTRVNRLLREMNEGGSAKRKEMVSDTKLPSWKRREQIKYMSDFDLASLTLEERKDYISLLVGLDDGWGVQFMLWTDDAAESAINRIIEYTHDSQAIAFSKWFYSKVGTYETLTSAIDGAEYKDFFAALDNLAQKRLMAEEARGPQKTPEQVEEEQQNSIMNKKLSHAKTLPWGSVQESGQTVRYNYTSELRQGENKYGSYTTYVVEQFKSNSNGDRMETKTFYFRPDEMIGVYFHEELEGVGKKDDMMQMPAVTFDRLLHEQFKQAVWTMVEFVGLILSFIPLFGQALAGLARIIAVADAIIASLSIIINHNKDKLPDWFVEAFGYIEMATMVFIFINPGKIAKLSEQADHLDDALKALTPAQRAVPGFERSVEAMRDVLRERAKTARKLSKAEEGELRKVLRELENAPVEKLDPGLMAAVRRHLDDLAGKTVQSSEEAAETTRKSADKVANTSQATTLSARKASMGEKVASKVDEAIPQGDQLILKSGADEVAAPVFASRKQMSDWIRANKDHANSIFDKLSVEKLTPEMHPWFFDAQGKLLDAVSHPYLYDAGRPLNVVELFGKGGKFAGNATEFKKLQVVGDLRATGAETIEDVVSFIGKIEDVAGPMDAPALRKLLSESGITLSSKLDEGFDEIVRKLKMYTPDPSQLASQREFTAGIMAKHLSGEIGDDMARKLMDYSKKFPENALSVERVIESVEWTADIEKRIARNAARADKARIGVQDARKELAQIGKGQMNFMVVPFLNPEKLEPIVKLAYYRVVQGVATVEEIIIEVEKLLNVRLSGQALEDVHTIIRKAEDEAGIITYANGRKLRRDAGGHYEWTGMKWQEISAEDFNRLTAEFSNAAESAGKAADEVESLIGKDINSLTEAPEGYRFVKLKDGSKGIRRLNAKDKRFQKLRVVDGKIVSGKVSNRISVPSRMIANMKKALGQDIPKNHQIHHLAPDNVVQKHPLYQELMARGLFDIDQESNLRALANKTGDKVEGISDLYPRHYSSHKEWDALVYRVANEYEELMLEKLNLKDLKEVSSEELINTFKLIEEELEFELKLWKGTRLN